MCNRFSQTDLKEIRAKWSKTHDPRGFFSSGSPRYNIAPTDEALVIINETGDSQIEQMVFGMVPHWAKDIKMGLNCLNARSETILEKPSFREPFKKRRCLIPVDGFYEWFREDKKKLPYRFVRTDKKPFALAGLWDEWISPHGKTLRSFCIITTSPNKLMEPIHDRMPVILDSAGETAWLNPNEPHPNELVSLLKPFSLDVMENYRVSETMNSSHNKGPECIQPLTLLF